MWCRCVQCALQCMCLVPASTSWTFSASVRTTNVTKLLDLEAVRVALSPNSTWLVASRLHTTFSTCQARRIESVSSRAVRQAPHSQNAWARHVEHVESCRDVTWWAKWNLGYTLWINCCFVAGLLDMLRWRRLRLEDYFGGRLARDYGWFLSSGYAGAAAAAFDATFVIPCTGWWSWHKLGQCVASTVCIPRRKLADNVSPEHYRSISASVACL